MTESAYEKFRLPWYPSRNATPLQVNVSVMDLAGLRIGKGRVCPGKHPLIAKRTSAVSTFSSSVKPRVVIVIQSWKDQPNAPDGVPPRSDFITMTCPNCG